MTTTLLLFTYNEIDGMRVVLPQIQREWVDQILVIDGNSTDGTSEFAREQGLEVYVQKEKGLGPAFLEALPLVKCDYFIAFTPDGNSLAEKIPEVTAKIIAEKADVVTVSRYKDGAKSYDDDPVTTFGNRMFTWLINVLFHIHITDGLVMYRAYNTERVRALHIDTKTVSWGSQILTRAAKAGYKILEIGGDEPERIGGVRKMRPVYNGIMELKMILGEFFNRH